MNDIFAMIGKVLGLCFAATVILYTSLLTWQLAGRIVPGNPIAQATDLPVRPAPRKAGVRWPWGWNKSQVHTG